MANTRSNSYAKSNTLDDLLGRPALIRGEDEAQYRRLLAAVTDDMQPQTFLDQIRARGLADKLWGQRRNRTSVAALVETSFIRALGDLLSNSMLREVSTEPPRELPDPWKPEPVHISVVQAHEYYDSKTTAARRREIDASLVRYGITQDQIRAKAMESCASAIQTFARLEENNDRFIRRTLKEHDRRARKQAKNPSGAQSGGEVD